MAQEIKKTRPIPASLLWKENAKTHNRIYDIEQKLCKLGVRNRYNNVILTSCYAQQKIKQMKLNNFLWRCTDFGNTVIILGDFSAQLGKAEEYTSIAGKYTLHEETNGNGEILSEFAITNNVEAMSTYFQRMQVHKGTWISTDQNTTKQIALVLINSKNNMIEDVRSMRGPNIDSDKF
jgi:hypothetical protein